MSPMRICRTKRPICRKNRFNLGSDFGAQGIQLVDPATLCTKYFHEKSRPRAPFRYIGEAIISASFNKTREKGTRG